MSAQLTFFKFSVPDLVKPIEVKLTVEKGRNIKFYLN